MTYRDTIRNASLAREVSNTTSCSRTRGGRDVDDELVESETQQVLRCVMEDGDCAGLGVKAFGCDWALLCVQRRRLFAARSRVLGQRGQVDVGGSTRSVFRLQANWQRLATARHFTVPGMPVDAVQNRHTNEGTERMSTMTTETAACTGYWGDSPAVAR